MGETGATGTKVRVPQPGTGHNGHWEQLQPWNWPPPWGQGWTKGGLGHGHEPLGIPGGSVGPMAGQGRAMENWRPALL